MSCLTLCIPDYKTRTFVAADREKNEMWVCFVSNIMTLMHLQTQLMCIILETSSWSKRDLPM